MTVTVGERDLGALSPTLPQLVIGLGEVGTAIAAVLGCKGRDIHEPDGTADVLHICIPWSPFFVAEVEMYRQSYEADLIIVHSTVPIGTCDPRGWVHSPVRGRHPNIEAGVKMFVKFFGGERADEAAIIFEQLGIETATTPRAAETEAGKLWELVQFGLQVKIEQAIWDHSIELGLNPGIVYGLFAHTYNRGYEALGEKRFVRPVLNHMPGPIGGHCVRQNAALLDHPLARLVVE